MEERETRERLARRSKTNIIGQLHRRHRSLAFRKLLDRIEAEVPAELDVHLILDNYGTHKTATIQRWLDSVARFCQRTLETGH